MSPLSTCYLYCDCDAMRGRSTDRLIISIRFAFVVSPAALGRTAQSVDIAGDWILALERYGQTDCQRMKITVVDGRVNVDTARRRRVGIGDRPGIAECNAELARLPRRPVPA